MGEGIKRAFLESYYFEDLLKHLEGYIEVKPNLTDFYSVKNILLKVLSVPSTNITQHS